MERKHLNSERLIDKNILCITYGIFIQKQLLDIP